MPSSAQGTTITETVTSTATSPSDSPTTSTRPRQPPSDEDEPRDPPSDWELAWEEEVLLPKVAGLDLDLDPPQPVNGAYEGADLRYSNDEALGMKLYTDPALSQPTTDGLPDAETCHRALLARPLYSADPEPGQVFCVGTTEGRIARLHVDHVDHVEYDGVTFRTTVWHTVN